MSKSIPTVTISLPSGATALTEQAGSAISPNKGIYQGMITLLKVRLPNYASSQIVRFYDRNGLLKFQNTMPCNASGATGSVGHPTAMPCPIEYGEYFTVAPTTGPTGPGYSASFDLEYTPDQR